MFTFKKIVISVVLIATAFGQQQDSSLVTIEPLKTNTLSFSTLTHRSLST